MPRRLVVAVAAVALFSAAFMGLFVPQTQAQEEGEGFQFCGDEEYGVGLRFHNKDLNPWNDPPPADDHPYHSSAAGLPYDPTITESSWQFFIQFQAVVNTSHDFAVSENVMSTLEGEGSFWFAFGPIEQAAMMEENGMGPGANCEKPWLPGFQLYSYRGDADPSDGFFVPINTTGVPDGTYGAAVYACTATNYDACQPGGEDGGGNPNLVAAAWTRATVYNGEDSCEDVSCERQMDFIEPWPLVLPGDGEGFTQPYADACDSGGPKQCVTIEFAERLATENGSAAPDGKAVQVWLNGIERTAELEAWEPPARDNDLILGNDGPETGHPLSDCRQLEQTSNIHPDARTCQKIVWGDAFKLQLDRELTENDEIRVRAVDGAGNPAEKVIAFQDATRGGVIEQIDADVDVTVTPKEQKIRPGDAKIYEVTVSNTGSDMVHTFPEAIADEGVEAQLSDDHVDIPGNSNRTITLSAGPTTDAEEGDYSVEIAFDYIAKDHDTGQSKRLTESTFATVIADESAALSGSGGNDDDGGDDDGGGPQSVPGGFERDCGTQGEFHVCLLYPGNLSAGQQFTFQARTQQAGESVEQRHDVSVGEADLTLQYLNEDGSEKVVEDESYAMEETAKGVYEADVTLAELAPMVHAIFDAEKVTLTKMIHRETAGEPQSAGTIPGFGAWALVAAAGTAALLIRRRD